MPRSSAAAAATATAAAATLALACAPSRLASAAQSLSAEEVQVAAIEKLHVACPIDCAVTQSDYVGSNGTLPWCLTENLDEMYGTACRADEGACAAYVESMLSDSVLIDAVGEDYDAFVAGAVEIKLLCDPDAPAAADGEDDEGEEAEDASVMADVSFATAEEASLFIETHCPRECAEDEDDAAAILDVHAATVPICEKGNDEDLEVTFGARCRAADCSMALRTILADSALAFVAAASFELSVQDFEWGATAVEHLCDPDYDGSPYPGQDDGEEPDAMAILQEFYTSCPKDCTHDPSEPFSACASPDDDEYGSACRASTECADFIDDGINNNPAGIAAVAELAEIDVTLLTMLLMSVKVSCGGDASPGYFDWPAVRQELYTACPKDCSNDAEERSLFGYPACFSEEVNEWGSECKKTGTCVAHINDLLSQDDLMAAWAQASFMEVDALGGYLMMGIGLVCEESIPGSRSALQVWMGLEQYCPRDCNEGGNDPELPECALGQDERGGRCKSVDCIEFLSGISESELTKMGVQAGGFSAYEMSFYITSLQGVCAPDEYQMPQILTDFFQACEMDCAEDKDQAEFLGVRRCNKKKKEEEYGIACSKSSKCTKFLSGMSAADDREMRKVSGDSSKKLKKEKARLAAVCKRKTKKSKKSSKKSKSKLSTKQKKEAKKCDKARKGKSACKKAGKNCAYKKKKCAYDP